MKLKLCFLLLLCLFFRAAAQDNNILKSGLVPGDPVPESAGLGKYRGRLLILDFWATWCAPCRKMLPVEDSLQRVFGDRLLILPVTYEAEQVVAPVLAAMRASHPIDLPMVYGDKVLTGLFPHRALPHYVWIDGKGVVRAITEDKEVTAANIRAMLDQGGGVSLASKKDVRIPFDNDRPMLIAGNGGDGASLRYHSLLAGYIPGLRGGMQISPYDSVRGQRFQVRNAPLTWLSRMAYGEEGRWFPDARVLILSKDSTKINTKITGPAYLNWLAAGSGWNYELLVPPGRSEEAFGMMQADLGRLFPQYIIGVERRKLRCLAMVRTGKEDKLKSTGGELVTEIGPYAATLQNAHLAQLMMRLERQFLQNYPLPVVDLTGYTARVDLHLTGNLWEVPVLNRELAAYGLTLRVQEAPIDVLVIRDAPEKLPKP